MNPWFAIGMLAFVALLIPLGMILISSLLRPTVPIAGKRAAYESGEIPTSSTHFRFDIQYYMVALLFVVFDIETIFIFPWALIYRDVAAYDLFWALVPMLIFIAVLFVGLIWAWSTGAIQWIVSEAISETEVPP